MSDSDSTLLHHGECDWCGSKDNRAFYDDGHSFCFSCDEDVAYQREDGEAAGAQLPVRREPEWRVSRKETKRSACR